eukprot:m.230215 g.230215  ORF g.230215 m.230215 type:complete len:338 (-) comp12029_c0_seq1:243-1256(-)
MHGSGSDGAAAASEEDEINKMETGVDGLPPANPAGACDLPQQVCGSNRLQEQEQELPVVTILGDFELCKGRVLGHGTFSRVFEGFHRVNQEKVAVKAVLLVRDHGTSFHNEVRMNNLAQGQSNIVPFRESFVIDGIGYLVHSLCPQGDLFMHIIPHSGLDQRELIGPYFAQLVDALVFLHSRGVCHLDVKPENMFLDRPGHIRLGDFGLSALAEDGPITGCRGSLSYAAPENLRSAGLGGQCAGYDGLRADMWSCGVVLFVLMFGITPWDVASDACGEYRAYKATDGYPNVRPWSRMSTIIRSIFHRTLCVVPNRRWTAAALKAYVARDCGWHGDRN